MLALLGTVRSSLSVNIVAKLYSDLLRSAALDELMDNGHVYSTVDESHFAVS